MLEVAQDVSKVNMEHLTVGLDHDVVVVTVSDAKDVSGHCVAGATQRELLLGQGKGAHTLQKTIRHVICSL